MDNSPFNLSFILPNQPLFLLIQCLRFLKIRLNNEIQQNCVMFTHQHDKTMVSMKFNILAYTTIPQSFPNHWQLEWADTSPTDIPNTHLLLLFWPFPEPSRSQTQVWPGASLDVSQPIEIRCWPVSGPRLPSSPGSPGWRTPVRRLCIPRSCSTACLLFHHRRRPQHRSWSPPTV